MPKKNKKPDKPKVKKRKYSRQGKDVDHININPKVVRSIAALFFYVSAILIILAFFSDGVWLDAINRINTRLFGYEKFVIPVLFFFAGNMLFKPKAKLSRPTLLLGAMILVLSSTSLFRIGEIGREFWLGLSTLISGLGALAVFVVGLIIGIMVFFELSLSDLFGSVVDFFARIRIKKETDDVMSLDEGQEIDHGDKKATFATDDTSWQNTPLLKSAATMATTVTNSINSATKPSGTISVPSVPLSSQANLLPSSTTPKAPVHVAWKLPPLALLSAAATSKADAGDTKANAQVIESTLQNFGIEVKVAECHAGPTVTQYAIRPALGTKLSKITALTNDLALALAAKTGQIRIEAPIPGKSLVGIEVPNLSSASVPLRTLLSHAVMRQNPSKLAIALGVDVNNQIVAMDINKLPHLLIAGQTGSGKSVAINVIIMSLLMRCTPNDVRFILVDPKRVELSGYNNIPHLLTPVIVEPEKVVSALRWAINSMTERYKQFAEVGARNIESYNKMAGFQAMPYIIIIIDELADIMLYAPAEVEDCICRLAQMARATGIHLILATQRPSVDVITGLIKANIPARMAFAVSSMMDSRVIIDSPGAEKLMGRGDMLFIPPEQAKPRRIQGSIVGDEEIKKVTEFLKQTGAPVQYTEEVTTQFKGKVGKKGAAAMDAASGETSEDIDDLFEETVKLICSYDKASTSLLQRKFKVGYNRAARIIDQLHEQGVISAADGQKPRDVLIKNADEFLATWKAKHA